MGWCAGAPSPRAGVTRRSQTPCCWKPFVSSRPAAVERHRPAAASPRVRPLRDDLLLQHHRVILVLQLVAVKDVRPGVVVKTHDEARAARGRDRDAVLPAE